MSAERRREQASEIMSGALMGIGLYAITRTAAVVYRELRRPVVANKDLRRTVVDLRRVINALVWEERPVGAYPANVCTNTKCRSGRAVPHMKGTTCP